MHQCIRDHRPVWLALIAVACYVGCAQADILVFSSSDSHKVQQGFRDLPARFGAAIPAEGVKGVVIYANPPTACTDIKSPPPNISDYNWIVLIARSNCTFETKVRNAERAGYSAAIVHNVNSNDLEPMSAKDATNITIPSVFVSEFTSSLLREVYSYDEGYFILINDLPLNINTHLLLPFAIVVGICFLVMVIFMVVRCIKDRRRQRRHRLPNSSLKKIPTHKYTKGDPYETCAICLEDYIENEKLRVLPCAHAYHTKCIDPWLTKNRRVCPVCKRKVFAADERVETDSESDSDVDDSTPLIRDRNARSGTQGGTFETTQTSENPPAARHHFWRPLLRSRQRRDSQTSGSSYESVSDHRTTVVRPNLESSSSNVEVEIGDAESMNNTETGSRIVFMASDGHSINDISCAGEMPDLERSVSSTRPHTISLAETDETCAPDVNHRGKHARNAARAGAVNTIPTSAVPRTSNDHDVII